MGDIRLMNETDAPTGNPTKTIIKLVIKLEEIRKDVCMCVCVFP